MEKNTYLFIIWHKVLWAKKRILDDLSKSFEIEKVLNVSWNKENYLNNLLALYGTKTNDATDKLKAIGYGDFCVILVRDNNEEFETTHKYDRDELVNKNINKKKKLYRKWTGTDFRIHSSENYNETRHDLTVLFGSNYEEVINNAKDTICLDTKGINGFNDIEDLCSCINSFGDYIYQNKDHLFIISRKRNDVLRFIYDYKHTSNNSYLVKIANEYKHINIYGEEEGDIPTGFINTMLSNDKFIDDFAEVENAYDINNNEVIKLFKKYNLSTELIKKETIRAKEKRSIIVSLKKGIKYIIAKLDNRLYLLKK